ncbi:MAG: response regulator [Desulfomonilaceae bacterium]|nr:response regulator [Desulfomonilaceae bacterium]
MNAGGKPKATILVIDDEQIVHESVRRILEEEGYRVDGALRVDQALDMLAKESYDLVLTDLMMPDRSGMEAVEAVARDQPDCGVVMFTGFATVDTAVESMKLGALDYLPKPFTPEELVQVTEKALEKTVKARRDREIEKTYADAEKALTSSLDLKEILNLICTSVVRLLKEKGASILLYKKTEGTMEAASSCGLSDEYLEKGLLDSEKSIPELLEIGVASVIHKDDFDSKLQYPAEARKEGISSILSVPLKVEDTVLGALRIYRSEERSLSDEEMDLLSKFAEQGAQALENAMAYERVRSDIAGLKRGLPSTVERKMREQA